MDETPKKPGEGEPTLSNVAPPAWEAVTPPATVPPLPPAGFLPPPASQAPPAAGPGGYRQVYDGGVAAGTPPNYPPPGYGGQPPYGQPGYPQSGYGGSNVAEMLALAVLMRRRRRWRRHFILWPLLFVMFILFVVLHGCISFLRVF